MLQDKRDVADVAAESRTTRAALCCARRRPTVLAYRRAPPPDIRAALPLTGESCHLLPPWLAWACISPPKFGQEWFTSPLLICQHAPSFTPLPLSPHSDVPTTCARASTVHRSTTPLHDRSSTTSPPSPDPTGRPNLYTLYHPQSMFRAVQVLNLTVPHPLDCVTRRHRE